jgi:hypothetical protein
MKPRVGWAGSVSHVGDLEIIVPVVETTENEFEWVFFGLCPQKIAPLVTELHPAVPFAQYPEKLASLNLDLALAPLERNNFNEAKSNLRLLEYGMLGWPVIATDIYPYQNAPVTRVPNNTRAWINALREHLSDLDSIGRAGDELRQWVLDNWILEDHLQDWLTALTPESSAAESSVGLLHLHTGTD